MVGDMQLSKQEKEVKDIVEGTVENTSQIDKCSFMAGYAGI